MISAPNLPVTVKTLFRTRIESFYDEKISSIGVFSTIFEALRKHDLLIHSEEWRRTAVFLSYSVWKKLVKERIILFEESRWSDHCLNHPNMEISRLFLENMPLDTFWSISNKFPDLVKHLHQQVCLIANYGLNGSVPWLCGTNGALCFFCKDEVEDCSHFFLRCETFKANFSSLWQNLNPQILLLSPTKILLYIVYFDPTDGTFIRSFLNNLDQNNKIHSIWEGYLFLLKRKLL